MEYREENGGGREELRSSSNGCPEPDFPYLIKAVSIAEDDKFYKHEGFDFEAVQQALEKNIQPESSRSGKHHHQQLARTLPDPSKNPVRKVKEAILTGAWRGPLEKKDHGAVLERVEWARASSEPKWRPAPGTESRRRPGPEEAARLAVVLPIPRYNPGAARNTWPTRRIVYTSWSAGHRHPVYEEIMTPAPAENPQSRPGSPSPSRAAEMLQGKRRQPGRLTLIEAASFYRMDP